MIEGIEILGYDGKDNRLVHFKYKDAIFWTLTELFEGYTVKDVDRLYQEHLKLVEQLKESENARKARYAAMSEEERKSYYESMRAIFERWQDEAETNWVLTEREKKNL